MLSAEHEAAHQELGVLRERALRRADQVHEDIWRQAVSQHLAGMHEGVTALGDSVWVHKRLHGA